MTKTIPHTMEWIDSGLDVRFDAKFIAEVAGGIKSEGNLEKLIDVHTHYVDMAANMDY